MNLKIDKVWLSAENRRDEIFNPINTSTDVVVQFEDGEKWIASFFTFRHIEQKKREYEKNGEFLEGKYFWANSMFLIEECSRELINNVLIYLIEEGDFRNVFTRLN